VTRADDDMPYVSERSLDRHSSFGGNTASVFRAEVLATSVASALMHDGCGLSRVTKATGGLLLKR